MNSWIGVLAAGDDRDGRSTAALSSNATTDVCGAFATLGSRRIGSNEEVIRKLLDACITACRLCGEECQRHAGRHEHCRVCAESCRRCERACLSALRSM